ncbi:hypothetical protein MIR68_011081 [Amoeboaphelidium protococcarum]|nr:hypothetical protein MIR68_011081 [Amoeboaphelidium protococcarum]
MQTNNEVSNILNSQQDLFYFSPLNDTVQPGLDQEQLADINGGEAVIKRPKLSLASLIGQAIMSQPGEKARLSTIYDWISNKYPEYYRLQTGGWQNSIRHNLTINKAFSRVPKSDDDGPGKGSYWRIDPDHQCEFKDGVFTGKIRSSDYRNHARSKQSKRQSAPDLTALSSHKSRRHTLAHNNKRQQNKASTLDKDCADQQQEDTPQTGLYFSQEKPTFAQSTPALMQRNFEEVADVYYQQATSQDTAMYDSIPAPIEGFLENFPYFGSGNPQIGSYSQYYPSTFSMISQQSQIQYSSGNQTSSWHMGHGDSSQTCSCAYCITLPAVNSISPHPELPTILEQSDLTNQATFGNGINSAALPSEAVQHQFPSYYQTSVTNAVATEEFDKLADVFPDKFGHEEKMD